MTLKVEPNVQVFVALACDQSLTSPFLVCPILDLTLSSPTTNSNSADCPSNLVGPSEKDRRRSDPNLVSRDAEKRPLKMRRLSDDQGAFGGSHTQNTHTPPATLLKPVTLPRRRKVPGGTSTPTPTSSRKGTEKENGNTDTPVNKETNKQRHRQDYSAFKGRGRYAKDPGSYVCHPWLFWCLYLFPC